MTLAVTLSVLIGVLLGLLGGGGSILTVPMLVYALHLPPKTAIATSFIVVGASGLIGLVPHARRGRVSWRSGLVFGLAGMAGAFGGGRLAGQISNELLMALFGVVTLVTGLAMLRGRGAEARNGSLEGTPAPRSVQGQSRRALDLRLLFDGFFVGGLTGLVGVGGGFLIVPALTLLVGLPMSTAVGTSLLVIVMNAVAGLGGYSQHVALDPALTGWVTVGAIAGSVAGSGLSGRIGAEALRRLFGGFILLVAGYVLYRSLTLDVMAGVQALLERHLEFFQGAAALAALLVLFRIGARIHRREGQADCGHQRLGRPNLH